SARSLHQAKGLLLRGLPKENWVEGGDQSLAIRRTLRCTHAAVLIKVRRVIFGATDRQTDPKNFPTTSVCSWCSIGKGALGLVAFFATAVMLNLSGTHFRNA